jgi:hypothetical protein
VIIYMCAYIHVCACQYMFVWLGDATRMELKLFANILKFFGGN